MDEGKQLLCYVLNRNSKEKQGKVISSDSYGWSVPYTLFCSQKQIQLKIFHSHHDHNIHWRSSGLSQPAQRISSSATFSMSISLYHSLLCQRHISACAVARYPNIYRQLTPLASSSIRETIWASCLENDSSVAQKQLFLLPLQGFQKPAQRLQ